MFTSKLPRFATSAKRQNDGSTSFSNIPVSVRKANLFTPQPNRTLAGSLSTSKSTIKPYMTTDKNYHRPRPAPDRDEQIKMFNTLVEYLQTNEPGFPIPDPKRFLQSVSQTEAVRIFEVLLGRFFAGLEIKKLDVDVPERLRILEYPFHRSVTKSALVSVTTRQAVGNLLFIFDWLIKQIAFTERLDNLELDDCIAISYMRGDEATDDEIDRQLDAVMTESDMLDAEMRELQPRYMEIKQLEEELTNFDHHKLELEEYFQQMQLYIGEKCSKKNELEHEINSLDCKIKEKIQILERLRNDPILDENDQVTFEELEKKLLAVQKAKEALIAKGNDVTQEAFYRDYLKIQEERDRLDKELTCAESTNQRELSELEIQEKEFKKYENSSLEVLRSVFESNKNEANNIVKNAQRENAFWRRLEERIDHNASVVRTGKKLIFN